MPVKTMKKILLSLLSICLISSIIFAVNSAPIETELITASESEGSTPLIIDFEPTQTSPDTSYKWEFSNGETIYSTTATQIFSLPGEYNAILTQTDSNGNSSSWSVTITALDEANCKADYDNDGFNNCEDLCPLVIGWEINRWCPLLEETCDANCGCSNDGYSCNFNGDQSTCGTAWVCLPDLPTSSCYYEAEKNYLFWNAVCNSCPCKNKLQYNATIRVCDILFPAIVSQDGKEIYEKGDFFEIN